MRPTNFLSLLLLTLMLGSCAVLKKPAPDCVFYEYETDKQTGFSNLVRERITPGSKYCWGRVLQKHGKRWWGAPFMGEVKVKGTDLSAYVANGYRNENGCYRILLPDSLRGREITLVFTSAVVLGMYEAETQQVTTTRRRIDMVMKPRRIPTQKPEKPMLFPN